MRYGHFEDVARRRCADRDGISGYLNVLREPTDADIDARVNLAKTSAPSRHAL
jgi:hypothetical protein